MIRRVVGFVAVALLGASVLVPSTTASAEATDDEATLVRLINRDRQNAGLDPLVVDGILMESARRHADRMGDARRIFHNSNLGSGIDGWNQLGENVGRGGTMESLHSAFMDSRDHRANMLNPAYDAVGIGVVWRGDVPYVVEVFMDSDRSGYTPPFRDDDGSVHEADIARLYDLGITKGCGAARYCPDQSMTRAEMASMLVRAFDLTGTPDVRFSDVGGSAHSQDIETLAANGVTVGCSPTRFCPDQPVSRGQMASFLSRVLDLPPGESGSFSDTQRNVHRKSIDALAGAGITYGCGADSFCPNSNVTRAQFASFLVRALDH